MARILIASLFWWSALFGFALDWPGTVAYVAAHGIPLPAVATAGAAAVELAAPVALFWHRSETAAALVLAFYCLATAALFHDFWHLAEPGRSNQMIHFYKNFSLAGALILVATRPRRT